MSIAEQPGPYPLAPLGEVLTHRKASIEIDDLTAYKRCRVQLHAQGIVLRDSVVGAEIKTKRQQVCRAGEFLVAEIDAKLGGFGIVPPDLEGAIVSSHYFLFEVNEAKLDRSFLSYYARTADFRDQVAAQGSTNYAAIRPRDVLSYTIPLPPLAEQRRVVARVEQIAARVAEARRLREEVDEDIKPFARSLTTSIIPGRLSDYPSIEFGSLLDRFRFEQVLDRNKVYNGLGTRMWGEGVYIHEQRSGDDFRAERYSIKSGQLVYNEVWAHNGAIGVVPAGMNDIVVSRHFHVFDVDWSQLATEYLSWIFRSPWFWHQCQEGSVGTSGRGHLRRKHLEQIQLPLPPLPEQRRIVAELDALQSKVDALRALQAETAAELGAMLPAVLDRAFRGEL